MRCDVSFDATLAAIRFGTGLRPGLAPASGPMDLLVPLTRPDAMAAAYPIQRFAELQPVLSEIRDLVRTRRQNRDTEVGRAAGKQIRKFRRAAREAYAVNIRQTVTRGAMTEDALRERLVMFWADHFTARGKAGVLQFSTGPYVEEAIRPRVTGRFADLLKAATAHPLMLIYLDQYISAGPNSPVARKQGRGLNENLAREVLELHTLGVDGPYTQDDVRELAELLTGLSYRPKSGFRWAPNMAEPGPETVLGKTYGGDTPRLEDIEAVAEDLAAHPATARHIARKLAVHFVSDTPDSALIDHVAARYTDSGGQLMEVYAALLEHPAAWDRTRPNVKPPMEFVISALRALDVTEARLQALKWKDAMLYLGTPLQVMGQAWERPVGPDGWPEADAEWVTPQGVAGRIQWAMTVPRVLRPDLPDPRDFVSEALGDAAPEAVRFAAASAEERREGVGLVLASPAFQRR